MGAPARDRQGGALSGVCPVLEVPFHDDGAVDVDGFAAVTSHVLATGVRSVMFPGYASEFHKLSDDERTRLTAELVRRCRGSGVASVVSVADHSTHLAVRSAAAAVDMGADALNVLPPHRVPVGRAGVLAHLDAVLAAAGTTPVVVQHAPAQTGVALEAAALAGLRAAHPNLTAVKVEAVPPGPTITALAELDPPLPSFVGYAGLQMVDAFRRGAVGVQPGCSVTELYVRVWTLLEAGQEDEAEALHRRMVPYLSSWMQGVEIVVAVEKEISRRRGLVRSAHCREPAHHLDPFERALVEEFLVEFADELAPGPGAS